MTDYRSTTTLDHPADTTPDFETDATTHPLAETGREAGERVGQLAERAADIGFQTADRGREQAASGVEQVAQTIRRVSTDMQQDQPQIADVAMTAADQAERIASYLRETDVRQMVSTVEDVARRQPLLFLGGAFILGMAASRFIKAAGAGSDSTTMSGSRRLGSGTDYLTGTTGAYGTGARTTEGL